MALLNGFEEPALYRGGYVAIGNFDGVHRGHQSMINQLTDLAQTASVPAVVLTFNPHPIELLKPDHVPPSLTTVETKAKLLQQFGVDFVIAYPTDRNLLNLSPVEFFDQIVVSKLDARGLIEGPNFFFGKNRSGNVETLQELCEAQQLTLDIVTAYEWQNEHVSSSAVRKLISRADFNRAVELLGHSYPLVGKVSAGAGRGRTLGFPTANLEEISTLLPQEGVYAAECFIAGQKYAAAVNIGPNPTFKTDELKIEAHLIDFNSDLYGEQLEVSLVRWIRPTRTFESVEELKQQIEADISSTQALIFPTS